MARSVGPPLARPPFRLSAGGAAPPVDRSAADNLQRRFDLGEDAEVIVLGPDGKLVGERRGGDDRVGPPPSRSRPANQLGEAGGNGLVIGQRNERRSYPPDNRCCRSSRGRVADLEARLEVTRRRTDPGNSFGDRAPVDRQHDRLTALDSRDHPRRVVPELANRYIHRWGTAGGGACGRAREQTDEARRGNSRAQGVGRGASPARYVARLRGRAGGGSASRRRSLSEPNSSPSSSTPWPQVRQRSGTNTERATATPAPPLAASDRPTTWSKASRAAEHRAGPGCRGRRGVRS